MSEHRGRAHGRLGGTAAGLLAVACALASAAPAAGRVPAQPTPEPQPEALLLIVDFSGSMLEPDGSGTTRLAAAKQALAEIIPALPEDLDVGLRVYGHRVPSKDKAAACQDTELVVPVGPLDRERLSRTIRDLDALGETPIGLSLQKAAADLPPDKPSTIILVSDGADECFPDLGPDPCQVAKDLVASGIDLKLETIGLQVEPEGRKQLECMAKAGGGEFTSVQDAGLLAEALAAARTRAQRTFEPRGTKVEGGPSLIDAVPLEPGIYTDTILDGESLWFAVQAQDGQDLTARVTLRTAGVPRDAKVALEWQDENAKRVNLTFLDGLATGQANTLAVPTGEVNGSRSPFGATRDAGTYYLSLRTQGFPAKTPHDFVLELLPAGQDAAPVSDGPSTSPASEASQPGQTPAPAAAAPLDLPPPPDPGPGVGLLAGLLLLVLASGGAYLLRRRRQSALDGPPPPEYY